MGHDIRVTAPPTRDHTWDADPAAPSAPVSPSEFWDNITIPLSAYIPNPRNGSPEHRTPPPVSEYTQHRGAPPLWGQSVPTWEPTFEPIPVDEPITSSSRLPVPDSNDSSYWSNVIEQREGRRPRLHRQQWGHIDRQLTASPRPPPELLAPHESRYYEYITDETSGEGTLQELPRQITIHSNAPLDTDGVPESESTPEPPLTPNSPRTITSDDTA